MSKRTWAMVLVSAALVLLVLAGVVLLGLALSGRMGPGMMTGRSLLPGRGFPGAGGLLGGHCPWCGGGGRVGPRWPREEAGWLGALFVLSLLCAAPLALLVVVVLVVRWAMRQHQAPPPPPSA